MKKLTKNKTDALSNGDIERIGNMLDSSLAPFATKTDLLATKKELKEEISGLEISLKAFIHEGVETVMEGMDKLSEQLAEKEKVEKMES
jgi:hypothetical protein